MPGAVNRVFDRVAAVADRLDAGGAIGPAEAAGRRELVAEGREAEARGHYEMGRRYQGALDGYTLAYLETKLAARGLLDAAEADRPAARALLAEALERNERRLAGEG